MATLKRLMVNLFLFLVINNTIKLIWSRLRLRRAVFSLRRQIFWSLRHAPRNKLVLDVGGGNNPHLRADVVCEKYIFDDFHRGANVARDIPLVAGDASALPFKTGIFDVIVSTHVIEHLEDPASFFEEAARVARSGLFTAPNAIQERLFSYPGHLWLIERQGDVLHFVGKSQPVVDREVYEFFEKHIMNSNLGVDGFTIDHWSSLEIDYYWTGKPKISVEGVPFIPEIRASTERNSAVVRHRVKGVEKVRLQIKQILRASIHRLLSKNQKINLAEIIACPKCHGEVVMTTDVYCAHCDLHYPIIEGIPIMLIDHAVAGTSGNTTTS